jgi:hypothetical protein
MLNKTPLTWLIAGLIAALAIILSGCSTDKPWEPNPSGTFTVFIISGPTDSLQVPLGSAVAYNWSYSNGTGAVQYQHNYDDGEWTALSRETVASVSNLTMGYHTFGIRAVDENGATSEVSAVFGVVETSIPTVVITESPDEGSFVAAGSSIEFTWVGDDGNVGPNYLTYQYTFGEYTSPWVPTNTVSFDQVAIADPAVFSVRARDLVGNTSEWVSVSFVIKNATILLIDDYLWTTGFGDADRAAEREQKQFYRDALYGFAYAEWDNDIAGAPIMANLAGYNTVIWLSDSDVCSADPNYRLWFDVGAEGGGVLKDFIDAGGHLILTGSEILGYLYNTNPPAAADFECAYLGVSDTVVIDAVDTTVTPWDTTYAPTWVSSSDFTWAVKDADQEGSYPDSMKIDVAKNGDQLACNASLVYLKAGIEPIFVTGLDVGNEEPENYGQVCGWLYAPGGTAKSATMAFDTYSMPMLGIRQAFRTILDRFGELPSF